MKKLLTLLLLACSVMACSDDDNTTPPPAEGPATFVGTLSVSPNEGSPFNSFSAEEIEFQLEECEDDCVNLLMPKIKFVEQMPTWISFEVRQIARVETDDTAAYHFYLAETLPYWNGEPYDPKGDGTYAIYNLEGSYSYDERKLHVEFDCYSMHVSYQGDWDPASALFQE